MASAPDRTSEVSIRPATEADCEVLTALMLGSAAYRGRYQAMIARYPVTQEMVRKAEVWVAERDGAIVGFYRLDVDNADLDLMFVADTAQGAGVGRTIFEHMTRFASDRGIASVQIVAHPPAADFYRRMGAEDAGVSGARSAEWWDRPILRLAIER